MSLKPDDHVDAKITLVSGHVQWTTEYREVEQLVKDYTLNKPHLYVTANGAEYFIPAKCVTMIEARRRSTRGVTTGDVAKLTGKAGTKEQKAEQKRLRRLVLKLQNEGAIEMVSDRKIAATRANLKALGVEDENHIASLIDMAT